MHQMQQLLLFMKLTNTKFPLMMKYKNIGIIANKGTEAIEQKEKLIKKYNFIDCKKTA